VPPGRAQLLFVSPGLQERIGKKYCDESELLPLLLAHNIIRRVRTFEVEVRPLGGDSFKTRLDASKPMVGEAKMEIARMQGTPEKRQELYKVQVHRDGSAVREDDADPELLDDDEQKLGDGEVVALAVKAQPAVWRTCDAGEVTLSEGGTVTTKSGAEKGQSGWTLVTSGEELMTCGRHYWEVELLSESIKCILVGVSRPSLEPNGVYFRRACKDAWFIDASKGSLFGNEKQSDDAAGGYEQGDRVGVLLDIDDGSLRFYKNGILHGPGFPPGSVIGPVSHAVQLCGLWDSVRLHPDVQDPTVDVSATEPPRQRVRRVLPS
jgi:hypothetical protein